MSRRYTAAAPAPARDEHAGGRIRHLSAQSLLIVAKPHQLLLEIRRISARNDGETSDRTVAGNSRRMFGFVRILLACCTCLLAIAGIAQAGVSLSSTGYRVSETAGQSTVTVNRTGSLHGDEYVRYGTHRASAVDGVDYQNVGGTLHFLPGQAQATFTIPIIARDWRGPSVRAAVYLYGSFPEKLGPHNAKLFILHNAPVETRDPTNPLELPGVPNASGNLLANARFYADPHHSPAAEAARRLRRRHPKEAGMIQEIADQPFTDRFGSWNGRSPESAVFQFLRDADVQDPASIPTLATYWIVNGQCARGGSADTPGRVADYQRFINGLSAGISNFRAVVFLEMDSLITTPCLHGRALAARMTELRYAVTTLEQNPTSSSTSTRAPATRFVQDRSSASDPRGYPSGPGLLPELHPLRLDHVGGGVRQEARRGAAWRTLRRLDLGQREGAAAPQGPCASRQRDPLRPA